MSLQKGKDPSSQPRKTYKLTKIYEKTFNLNDGVGFTTCRM